jgi:hypothetical protein
VHSAGFITGVRLDGQSVRGSRERHEVRGHVVYYVRNLEQEPHEIPEKTLAAPGASKWRLEIKDAVLKDRSEPFPYP